MKTFGIAAEKKEDGGENEFFSYTPSQLLERRLATLYGPNSSAIEALDLVREEMCAAKGFMRDDGQDYYNHCIHVADTLLLFGIKDEDVICAALLHDIIEDIERYTEQILTRMFNSNVARLVMLVTKEPNTDYKKPENMYQYLKAVSDDMYASAIKTADRMHNMMTLEEKTSEARYRKALETEEYYMPFFAVCASKYPRYEALFTYAKGQIYPLIFGIKSSYRQIESLRAENERLKKENEALRNQID